MPVDIGLELEDLVMRRRVTLQVALGQPYRTDRHADRGHHLAAIGHDQLGRTTADIDDDIRACEIRECTCDRLVGKLGFARARDDLDRATEDLLRRCHELGRVLGFAHRLGRDHVGNLDAVLVHHAAVLAADVQALRDGVGREVAARVETLTEPTEPAQVDDALELFVDDQQQQRVGADVDNGGVHRPSRFATITFMISFVPA